MRTIVALSLVSLFSGCVIYEEELVEDTATDLPDSRPDPDAEEPDLAFELWLNPAGAVAGQTTIVSLFADGEADLGTIDSLRFFGDGDLEVLATDARSPHEFLLTISVPQGAELGGNDLLVEFDDGTAAFVDAAFTVVADASQIPPSSGSPDGACP